MSAANHLHLISPSVIRVGSGFSQVETYSIFNVEPLVINSGDLVYVKFNTTFPSDSDWIGAYSPPDIDISTSTPVKFGYCSEPSSSNYLVSGSGQLAFNMTNLRAGIKFYYFTGGVHTPVLVASSEKVVEFQDNNQPLRNRIIPTGDPNVFKLVWSSATSTAPVLKWGTEKNNYPYVVNAVTSTITNTSLCGGVAVKEGWRDLGLIHTANFTGLVDLGLSSANISYIFGDQDTNDFSPEFTFLTPPFAGMQPPGRPTTVALFADLGVGSSDNSYDTTVWHEQCPPATNTSYSIGDLVRRGLIDAAFHSGDISYANGYLSGWDFFLDMVSPISGALCID
jgi:acid phosphatase type 7